MPPSHVRDISDAEFATAVLERSRTVPVVVDFWAEWCGPCKTLGPMLEKVTADYDGAFELAKIDVDANPQIAGQLGVQGIPTVVAFVDGQPVTSFSGAIPESQLREWIGEFVDPTTDPEVDAALDLIDRGRTDEAETLLRAILTDRPEPDAAKALAMLFIDQDRMDQASEVLATLGPDDPEAKRLRDIVALASSAGQADELAAAFSADPDNADARIAYARALAGRGAYDEAFDLLLEAVAGRGDDAEPCRAALVDMFDLLGPDHPLVGPARRRLANALF